MEPGKEVDRPEDPPAGASPLLRAADLVVRTFCVGESLSIPLLHGSWQSATYPLPRAVLGRIVRDEAAHGLVGWTFLDWAEPYLTAADREHLVLAANGAIGEVLKLWRRIRDRKKTVATEPNGLGWMGDEPYLILAAHALEQKVILPLRERGFDVDSPRL